MYNMYNKYNIILYCRGNFMSKKQSVEKSQVMPIIIGLVIALITIVVCGKILISQINSDKSSKNEVTSSVNSIPQEVTSIEKDEIVITTPETTTTSQETEVTEKAFDNKLVSAQQCLGMSGTVLEKKFLPEYDNFGYINGGYTISDDSVYPFLQFVVTIDENNKVTDTPISNIIVLPGGKIDEGMFVGMTYAQLKEIVGDKIEPIESDEENCMYAGIDMDSYTATIEFEFSGGKSVKANVGVKQ